VTRQLISLNIHCGAVFPYVDECCVGQCCPVHHFKILIISTSIRLCQGVCVRGWGFGQFYLCIFVTCMCIFHYCILCISGSLSLLHIRLLTLVLDTFLRSK